MADLFAHLLDLRDLTRVALGNVVAAEDDDVPLEEHEEVVVAVQEHAELAVQLSEPGQLTGLFALRQGLQFARNAGEWGILIPYPEAEWVFFPESIMPPRPMERSSRAKGHDARGRRKPILLRDRCENNILI